MIWFIYPRYSSQRQQKGTQNISFYNTSATPSYINTALAFSYLAVNDCSSSQITLVDLDTKFQHNSPYQLSSGQLVTFLYYSPSAKTKAMAQKPKGATVAHIPY